MLGPKFAGDQLFNQAGSEGKGFVQGSKTDINVALLRVVTVVGIKTSFSMAEVSVLLAIELVGILGQFTPNKQMGDKTIINAHWTIFNEIERKGV